LNNFLLAGQTDFGQNQVPGVTADFVMEEAKQDYLAGRCKPLDETLNEKINFPLGSAVGAKSL